MDLYTFNFDYIGSRTTGNDGGTYLIAGPRWKGDTPKGHQQGHPLGDRPDHRGRAHAAVQSRRPRQRGEDPGRLQDPAAVGLPRHASAARAAGELASRPSRRRRSGPRSEFFNQLAFLLQFAQPTHASEAALRKRFARSASNRASRFDVAALPPDVAGRAQAGMVDGQKADRCERASLEAGPIRCSATARS